MTRAERSDAARNRAAVLAAADELFATVPEPARLSMDDVAAAAGVGKGTLFAPSATGPGSSRPYGSVGTSLSVTRSKVGRRPSARRPTRASASRPFSTPSSLSSSTTAI